MVRHPGQSLESACNWAVYGFTVQDWLTFEAYMAKLAGYVEQLRAQIHFLKNLMNDRQEVIDKQIEALQGINKKQESVTYE